MNDLQPILRSQPTEKCANPNCDTVVGCRGDFCRECELQQRIMRVTYRGLRARKESE